MMPTQSDICSYNTGASLPDKYERIHQKQIPVHVYVAGKWGDMQGPGWENMFTSRGKSRAQISRESKNSSTCLPTELRRTDKGLSWKATEGNRDPGPIGTLASGVTQSDISWILGVMWNEHKHVLGLRFHMRYAGI